MTKSIVELAGQLGRGHACSSRPLAKSQTRTRVSLLTTMDRQSGVNPKPRPLYPVPPHDSTLVSINSDKEATRSVIRLLYKQPKRSNTTEASYRQHLVEELFGAMFNDRFSEMTQKPNPPFINAFAAQGDLVRSAESFTLSAIVADNGIIRGLNALLTEGERARHAKRAASEEH